MPTVAILGGGKGTRMRDAEDTVLLNELWDRGDAPWRRLVRA